MKASERKNFGIWNISIIVLAIITMNILDDILTIQSSLLKTIIEFIVIIIITILLFFIKYIVTRKLK